MTSILRGSRRLAANGRLISGMIKHRFARTRERFRRTGHRLRLARATKVIIGASGTTMPGWVSTDVDTLDLCAFKSFSRIWSDRGSPISCGTCLGAFGRVCALEAVKNCSGFLAPCGRLRVAVPDGNHPDPKYIEYVRPGGTGPGCDDHKRLFTVSTLCDLINEGGLVPVPMEWWDSDGNFHKEVWNVEDGLVTRSADYDERNKIVPLSYTSLIVDAFKIDENPSRSRSCSCAREAKRADEGTRPVGGSASL